MTTLTAMLAAPPTRCPECRVRLNRAYPACPACGEALTPAALKARAEAAAEAGLGLEEREDWSLP